MSYIRYCRDAKKTSTGSVIVQSQLPDSNKLNIGAGESNKLGLMVIDNTGVLYLNDQKVSELNLTRTFTTGIGTAGISVSYLNGDEWEPVGTVIEYEDWNLWSFGD